MTTAYWCVLLAGLLPYLWTAVAKGSGRDFKSRDNHNPREFLERLEGGRKRAHWAHLNAFEAFPFFAAAVIIAHIVGSNQHTIDMIAVVYVVLRILHGIFYIFDKSTLRSLVWFGALGCVIALFIIAP